MEFAVAPEIRQAIVERVSGRFWATPSSPTRTTMRRCGLGAGAATTGSSPLGAGLLPRRYPGPVSDRGGSGEARPWQGADHDPGLRLLPPRLRVCSGIFSSGWASARHRCQGCPQNGARCRRGRQSIWCTSSASSRPSARSRRRRSPEPLLAKCKASGIFSSSFYSVSLLYWSHTKKHTAEVLPFSAGKS